MDVLRAVAQARFPKAAELLVISGLCSPPPTFSFPSSISFAYPPRDYSTLKCWKYPRLLKGILYWHSAAISDGHVIWIRMNITTISIFQALAKWLLTGFGKELLWQEKCLFLDGSRCISMDLRQYFRGWAVQPNRNMLVNLDTLR